VVSLVDLFGTLTELCGIAAESRHRKPQPRPLLRDPAGRMAARRHHPSRQAQNYAISTERWRYIHYDPLEWANLATKKNSTTTLDRF
jgi:hypothetical protein